MKKKSSKFLILLIIFVLFGIVLYYYFFYDKKESDSGSLNEEIEKLENNGNEDIYCDEGYICENINGTEYKWTNKKVLNLINVYNYDNDEFEAGTLEITDEGKLVFYDLEKKILKEYNEISGKIIAMEVSIDSCEDSFIYLVITDEGKIYRSDAHLGLTVNEAFTPFVENYKFVNFYTVVNKTDYSCTVTEIYAKTEDGEIIKLVSNENITQ